jgi:hypothetical protein
MVVVIRVNFMYFIEGMCQWLIHYLAVVFDFAPFSEVHSVNTDFQELKASVIWDVMPCNLVDHFQHFRGT